jgi:CubicO group peptidase (beta-lactamase class C family)
MIPTAFRGAALVRRGQTAAVDAAYGYANRETGELNTPNTAFQIASVSKTFTAAAILLLEQERAISVQDRIASFVGNCPDDWALITLHHLLTHSSGIGHWQDFPAIDLWQPKPRADLIRIFQSKPLAFRPGAAWSYSSPGYVLLAHVVEQVAGQPYAAFLRERICRPLGLASTGAGNAPPLTVRRAAGYEGEERVPSFELDEVGIGADDIWSTTGDLARWNRALASPGLLDEESLRAMLAAQVPAGDGYEGITRTHYGYGWFIGRLDDRPVAFHSGDNAGFRAFTVWWPRDDAMVILLSNDHQFDVSRLAVAYARR